MRLEPVAAGDVGRPVAQEPRRLAPGSISRCHSVATRLGALPVLKAKSPRVRAFLRRASSKNSQQFQKSGRKRLRRRNWIAVIPCQGGPISLAQWVLPLVAWSTTPI
jgi:hypothetical protein